MTQTTKTKVWIGDISYSGSLHCGINYDGRVDSGVLFKTKQDAKFAGWKKPKRIEITVRVL